MELIELIKKSANIVAFTGAGISTESDIPDFRSVNGLYSSEKFDGYTPDQILSRRFFLTEKKIFFSFYKKRILSMLDKQPNRSHKALQKLESIDKLTCIITQNIDNLHQKAGSKNVLDLHGNITQYRCISACGAKFYNQEQFFKMLDGDKIPRCDCGGVVRPNTVLFDEWLNDDIFDEATVAIINSDLILAIGSSLQVQPAAGLLSEKKENCKLVIINKDPTPYDKKATLVINENCGDVLEQIVNLL